MSKNLVRNNKQPLAMEPKMSSAEAKAASGNLQAGVAYEAAMKVNAARDQPHMGNQPASGSGKF